MKSKTMKIVGAVLVAVMLIMIGTSVFAAPAGSDYTDPGRIVAEDPSGTAGRVQKIAGQILSVVQVVAISVAVIMIIVLAIKYISASPNDKAEIKSHLVVYVVGAVCLFGATGILQLIKTLVLQFAEA